MTRQPMTIAFHVGAHKTATTHLQKTIKRAIAPLADDGVRFYGPENFRMPGRTIPALFGFQSGKGPQTTDRDPRDQLTRLAKGASRLVLSEENFIGPLNSAKGLGLRKRYKAAGTRLSQLAAATGHEIEVFLAIRRPTGFLNSAYCQMLLAGDVRPLGVYLRRNPLSGVDWVDLVDRIRQAPGVGAVTVWKYEDYNAVFPRITAGLLGEGPARHVPTVARQINPGLSASAVAEILHREGAEDMRAVAKDARALLSVLDGYPPFDAFDAEEHAISDAIYRQQVAQIAQMPGVTLLQPEKS
ncbi:hypothetical protein [Yoonia litorea]|uniref:Sulfotransferase family protein n=1 Tax=Yoonia litorea TaxID=1123755 RepID=A0A1I6N2D2_9RHOB|nr:hypothetical protein [Yoonia litorea]SFS22125.1 hypothetical protein SAMN05444714_3148 [Yoonia litorea]